MQNTPSTSDALTCDDFESHHLGLLLTTMRDEAILSDSAIQQLDARARSAAEAK